MLLEYLKYSYNHAFRYLRRFLTLVLGVAVTTFSLLILLMTITDIHNEIVNIEKQTVDQEINLKQLIISPKSVNQPINPEILEQIREYKEVENAYYYEDMTYTLEGDDIFAPWLEWNDQINLQMHPIILDESAAKEYGLADKIIHGSYFSGDPYEIILSTDLLHRFANTNEVFRDNLYILGDERLNELQDGNGNQVKPEEIIGKTVIFTYETTLESKKEGEKDAIWIYPVGSVRLKVVGVFDPSLGYKTTGDAWLPYGLKKEMTNLSGNSASILGAQIAVRTKNLSDAISLKGKLASLPFQVQQSQELSHNIENRLNRFHIQQQFFQSCLYVAIAVSLLSIAAICMLLTIERRYDFTLQHALGASRTKIAGWYSLEILFATGNGVLFGLLLTFLFLWSNLRKWLRIPEYLDGSLLFWTIVGIMIAVLTIAILSLFWLMRRNLVTSLSGGE